MNNNIMEGICASSRFAIQSTQDYYNVGQRLCEDWGNFPTRDHTGNPTIKGYQHRNSLNFMKGITENSKKYLTAVLLENSYNFTRQMDETTKTLAVGNLEKYIFPIIKMTFSNLAADDWVSIQPLTGPTGLVFYYDAVAGTTKGRINRGQRLYDARTGPNTRDYNYTSETVEGEQLAVGAGAAQVTGNFSYIPIRPGTVVITDGTQEVVDDGDGNLVGDVAAGNNTISYATGAYDVTFAAPVANGDIVETTYQYNMEANDNLPEMDIQLSSTPVVTRPFKLRSRIAMEAAQDLSAVHNISAETEFVTLMSNYIAQEQNYAVLYHLRNIAPNANAPILFDIQAPAGVSFRDHKEILIQNLVETSNLIFTQTRRVNANWMVMGMTIANILETLQPHYIPLPPTEGVTGVRKSGHVSDMAVYKDPQYPTDEWLCGHKSSLFHNIGYVLAIYQGLVSTPQITLDDFIIRRGLMSRVARKVVNNNFYARGQMTNTNTIP